MSLSRMLCYIDEMLKHRDNLLTVRAPKLNLHNITFPVAKSLVGFVVRFRDARKKITYTSLVSKYRAKTRNHTLAHPPSPMNMSIHTPYTGHRQLHTYHEKGLLEIQCPTSLNFVLSTSLRGAPRDANGASHAQEPISTLPAKRIAPLMVSSETISGIG